LAACLRAQLLPAELIVSREHVTTRLRKRKCTYASLRCGESASKCLLTGLHAGARSAQRGLARDLFEGSGRKAWEGLPMHDAKLRRSDGAAGSSDNAEALEAGALGLGLDIEARREMARRRNLE